MCGAAIPQVAPPHTLCAARNTAQPPRPTLRPRCARACSTRHAQAPVKMVLNWRAAMCRQDAAVSRSLVLRLLSPAARPTALNSSMSPAYEKCRPAPTMKPTPPSASRTSRLSCHKRAAVRW
eukprot:1901487-Prymnesium_polylepis.1